MVIIDERLLEKTLKAIIKNGKYVIGRKEVSKSIKSSKLVVYSGLIDEIDILKIKELCKSASVPIFEFPNSSVSLGRICGMPFKVSVFSVRSAGDIDISSLIGKQT
jgi:large subunit ribosomal protein L30e